VPIYPLDTPERESIIARAAEALRSGELVAFPTETVYGLGASALNKHAVQKIFEAKGRPSYNPLIVHVLDATAARGLVAEWTKTAQLLADAFWPGPLSLVLRKQPYVPDIVTAGLPSVALRAPSHPVARELLEACRLPLAAPSANRFTELSPTTAAHVQNALGNRVDMILDGGPSEVGIESTVLDLTGEIPVLLRPGTISIDALRAVVGEVLLPQQESIGTAPRLAPGMIERHYAPRAQLVMLVDSAAEGAAQNGKCGLLHWSTAPREGSFIKVVAMPTDAIGYASQLYSALHEMDEIGCERIYVEPVPDGPQWLGVRDRLRRATAKE
jgi:L-threonylcarbamoyladenylate synthase